MSVINSLVGLYGGQFGFVIGLGITQVFDAVLTRGSDGFIARLIGPILTAGMAGIFCVCGYYAREGRRAAFITGMTLYALDSLLFVLVRDVVGVAFHAFALFWLLRGLQAKQQLDAQPTRRPTIASESGELTR